MKGATSFIIVLALFVASCGGSFYLYTVAREREKKLNERIDDISARRVQIVNVDSLRGVIEKHIIDSLKGELAENNRNIDRLRKDLTQTRNENEKLQNLYNSLRVNMPEF